MRIGINAHLLTSTQGYRNAGVGRYIYYLLRSLAARDDAIDYTVYCHDAPPIDDPARGPHMRYLQSRMDTIQPAKRIIYEQVVLPRRMGRRLDLLHAPVNVVPLASVVPSIVTIHDLSFMVMPERFLPAKRRYLTHFTALSVRRARHIVTDSEHTRQDVIRLLGAAPERVTTVPLGVLDHFTPPTADEAARFRDAHGLPDKYLLYLGTLEPRKNLGTLVRAYARARRDGLAWPLVLAGGRGWLFEDIFRAVQEEGIEDAVIFPGYVPFEEQPLWYGSSSLFIYPSLYEGFGLPILEAMACGTPVLSSNASCLPEAAGDAAVLVEARGVEAQSVERLCDQITRLAADPERREVMRSAGIERARQFTWERTAGEMVKLYREVGRAR